MESNYVRQLVVARLQAMPPNASFSIGKLGDFTKDELIKEVMNGSRAGEAAIEMELKFLREMPRLSKELSG